VGSEVKDCEVNTHPLHKKPPTLTFNLYKNQLIWLLSKKKKTFIKIISSYYIHHCCAPWPRPLNNSHFSFIF